jgi:hypothetical protein
MGEWRFCNEQSGMPGTAIVAGDWERLLGIGDAYRLRNGPLPHKADLRIQLSDVVEPRPIAVVCLLSVSIFK